MSHPRRDTVFWWAYVAILAGAALFIAHTFVPPGDPATPPDDRRTDHDGSTTPPDGPDETSG